MKNEINTPKKLINYFKWIESHNKAICDGLTDSYDISFSILYPIFIITGIGIFIHILIFWNEIKDKIGGKKI